MILSLTKQAAGCNFFVQLDDDLCCTKGSVGRGRGAVVSFQQEMMKKEGFSIPSDHRVIHSYSKHS